MYKLVKEGLIDFSVDTADAGAAAGTETFDYIIVN